MADPILTAEQEHLATSRAALAQMYADAVRWETAVGGDHVSTQFLRQQLHRRRLALMDDPDVPLFFGRLDYRRRLGADLDERLYVGRRHVTGEIGGEPLVIDWRAPMALPFYRASTLDPMGVELRRRFGFHGGTLTAYEDELLDRPTDTTDAPSSILAEEIERPRTGPMRDIVATIQPEQDVLVRASLEDSLCIQGAPGTGKTAVGLHRAAYLLYAFREQLKRSGVLVVGPNDSFLSYIGDVLPALGEIDAESRTVVSMTAELTGLRVKGVDPTPTAVLKGDPRMAELLARYVWGQLVEPTTTLEVQVGHRTWRVPARFAQQSMEAIRARGIHYAAGRAMLPQQLAHQVLLRMEAAGDSPDDRVQNQVARTRAVKDYVAAHWPALKPRDVLCALFSSAETMATWADGLFDADEQATLLWAKPPRSAGSATWSEQDLVLADEVADLLERTPSLGHVIIDEAQDLSAMALRAVGRRATTGSVTLLGDLAQATTPWATTSWEESLRHLGKPEAGIHELTAGFRVPPSVIDYAVRLLPSIAPGLAKPHSVRSGTGDLEIVAVEPAGPESETPDPEPVQTALVAQVRRLAGRDGTVGVIVPDAMVPTTGSALAEAGIAARLLGSEDPEDPEWESHVDLVPTSLAKGLEFDHVVLAEPAAVVDGEPDRVTGLRRLYVCLTRAVTSLVVVHARALPVELGTPAP